jgi:hypothetical protein
MTNSLQNSPLEANQSGYNIREKTSEYTTKKLAAQVDIGPTFQGEENIK